MFSDTSARGLGRELRGATVAVLLASALTASCGGGASSVAPTGTVAAFDYATTEAHPFQVTVLLDGVPASGARVQLLAPLPPLAENDAPNVGTTLFATGLTGADGQFSGEFSAPSTVRSFDLAVQLPGASGPLEPAGYAALWGPFAPSARVRTQPFELDDVVIQLTSE